MNLFDNPIMQKMFLGKAKSLVAEHKIKAIIITPDANGDLQFQLEKEDVVIISRKEFDNMIKVITSNGQQ